MATPDLFRFYLMKNDTDYFSVSNGIVGATQVAKPLEYAPDGWEDTELKWGRSETYWGIIRSYSAPYEFTKDGASILRYVYYTEGIEGACKLVVQKRNDSTWEYQDYYRGDIDFSQFVDKLTSVTAVMMEAGLSALLKANENVPYEIPLDADALSVYMDGIRLKNSSSLALSNDPLATQSWHQLMPVITDYFDESDIKVDVIQQPNQQALGTTNLIQNFPFHKASISGDVIIKFSLDIQVSNSAGSNLGGKEYRVVIVKYNAATNTPTVYNLLIVSNYLNIVGRQISNGTITIPMVSGETLSYFGGVYPFNLTNGSDAFLVEQLYNFSTLEVKYDLRLPATTIRAYRFYQVFQKLSNKIAGNTTGQTAVSRFLSNPNLKTVDNIPFNVVVTSGDGLRGLTVNTLGQPTSPSIRTTYADLFKAAQAVWGMSLGIENEQIVMEDDAYFFPNISIGNIGTVSSKDAEIHVASEYMGNLINVGYEPQQYDDLNGKDEPNNTSSYKLSIIRKVAAFDWISPFRADMHGIESIRANLTNKTTTDSENDNDTFLIDISASLNRSGAFLLNRPQNLSGNNVSGLIAGDTAINLTITPARNFYRNGGRVRIATHLREQTAATFQTSDKNKTLISNLGSGRIAEADDIPISRLRKPPFLPIALKFKKSIEGLNEIMMQGDKGYFDFMLDDVPLKGYVGDVGVTPATNDVFECSLLLHPDTDMNLLLKIFE